MLSRRLFPLFALAIIGCTAPDSKDAVVPEEAAPEEEAQQEPTDPLEADEPSSTPDEIDPLPSGDPVHVDCVSELVTHSGNYYALSAQVASDGALVEMVHYRAATPTSDPEEEAIWGALVADARFTPFEFVFETEEHFLNVRKAEGERLYIGTMSGQTEFEGDVEVTCWPADEELPARYDAESGDCLDEAGQPTRNDIPWMVAVRTGFGQCANFTGQLNGEAFGYPTFDLLDLRGAAFEGAALHFAELRDSQLEGADLRGFEFGYAIVEGSIDEHTQLPSFQECGAVEPGETKFSCTR